MSVRDAPVNEPILHAVTAPEMPTLDERWEQSTDEGARQEARSGRTVRLIAFFVALALAIGLVWAAGPSR